MNLSWLYYVLDNWLPYTAPEQWFCLVLFRLVIPLAVTVGGVWIGIEIVFSVFDSKPWPILRQGVKWIAKWITLGSLALAILPYVLPMAAIAVTLWGIYCLGEWYISHLRGVQTRLTEQPAQEPAARPLGVYPGHQSIPRQRRRRPHP